MIAVFWADVITSQHGNVSYREVLRLSLNDNLFENADIIIRNTFISMKEFLSSWMFIATWDEVQYFGAPWNSVIVRHNSDSFLYFFRIFWNTLS